MQNKIIHATLSLLLATLASTVQAQGWQFGVQTEYSRSPFIEDSRDTHTLPTVAYFGEKLVFDGGKLLYALGQRMGKGIYLAGSLRPRQYYSADIDFEDDLGLAGMQDRDPALELGLGWETGTSPGSWSVEGLFDVSGAHEGYELTVGYRYPISIGPWLLEPALGLQLQSADLVDYYHGVRASEARVDRPAYEGKQAANLVAALTVGYALDARLFVFAGLEQVTLDSGITDSPVVDQTESRKFLLGLSYGF